MGLMAVYLALLMLLLLVLDALPQESESVKLPDIYWNATNPIFRIDNTDHIIDVNRDNLPYDQVNIICPVYAPGTKEEDAEKYIIYNVSKEEYDTCRITNPNPRIIAVCDKPYKLMYFTITFRSFTPQPGGLEFRPGQDYYFISTSSRDDLHRRMGGRCLSENMKVVFKVCCHPGESSAPSTTGVPALPPVPRVTTTPSTPPPLNPMMTMITRRPIIVYTSSASTKTTAALLPPVPTNNRYPHKKYSTSNNPTQKPPSKKKETEKHPNEVVKNEELTSKSGISNSKSHLVSSLLLVVSLANQIWRVR